MAFGAGVFVTGTGTEVGKTVVASMIAREHAARGERVAVFKPAVTGIDEGGEADYELLRRGAGSKQTDDEIAPYRFGPLASPHLAAELAGQGIEPERLLAGARAAAAGANFLVCEGVGGILVPLTEDLRYLIRDFARDLGLPVVIAAAPGLGTINHTLLTLESARAGGLDVVSVALTPWPTAPSPIEESNRETIGVLGDVRVLTVPAIELEKPEDWPPIRPLRPA